MKTAKTIITKRPEDTRAIYMAEELLSQKPTKNKKELLDSLSIERDALVKMDNEGNNSALNKIRVLMNSKIIENTFIIFVVIVCGVAIIETVGGVPIKMILSTVFSFIAMLFQGR